MDESKMIMRYLDQVWNSYNMFLAIFGGLFCSYLSFGATIPVLPNYVKNQLGAGDIAVGVVITATALAAVITRPLSGMLADKHGYRFVMLWGAGLVSVTSLLYFIPLGVTGLVGMRFLLGIGEATVFTAGAIWTISLSPKEKKGKLIGLYGVSMWAGITLGSFIGSILYAWGGYKFVWAFAIFIPLVGLYLLILTSDISQGNSAQHPVMIPPAVLRPGVALALASAGYAGLAAFIVLHLKYRGIDGGVYVFMAYGATYAGTRLYLGHLPDKIGPKRVIIGGGLCEALGLIIISQSANLWQAIIGGLIMGTGFSLLYPALALMVINRVKENQQGAALGAYTSFWDLGLGIWGPLTGLIASIFDYVTVFLFCALCALSAVVLIITEQTEKE